jgi:hypothetical protein
MGLKRLFHRWPFAEPETSARILDSFDPALRCFPAEILRNSSVQLAPSGKHVSELARSQNQ